MTPRKQNRNEEGSVLLAALIILLLVTFLGFNSLTMTSSELKISGNDRTYRQNFYRAESVIKEAALDLESRDKATPGNSQLPWLSDGKDPNNTFDPESQQWNTSGTDQNASTSSYYTDNSAEYCALRMGVAPGSNQDMSGERKWEYVIYGQSRLSSGQVRIAAGFLKKND